MANSDGATTSAHSGSAASTSPLQGWRAWPIGDLLARVIVPLWVLAGAGFKLYERDARLLPEPIIDIVRFFAYGFVDERSQVWLLDSTLRTLIGIELALVVAMVIAPKISRFVASFTLVVFLLVLAEVMRRDFFAGGISQMFSGSCGCLGAKSPPPPLMFLIDAALLAGVLFFPIRSSFGAASLRLVPLGLVFGGIAAFSLAVLTPPRTMIVIIPEDEEDVVEISQPDEPRTDDRPTVRPDDRPDPRPAAATWPAPPEPASMYFPQVANWLGRPMVEIDLLRQMRPAPPAELLAGISYIVVYRGDCGNCHELLAALMAGDRAPRTITLRVAEGDPAADKEMPSDRFHRRNLPGGPNYVLTAPLLAIAVDGVIRAAEAGVSLELAKVMLESAEVEFAAAQAGPGGADAIEPPTPPVATERRAWPGRPPVEEMYFPQFEQWVGRRLDAQPLALQINRPMPVNEGRWHLIFYRADCDSCHEMMELYLVGELEPRVIAVRIPDTDPAADLPMPLSRSIRRSLPSGPTYVVQTPVLLTIEDGVVRCMATDPRDPDSVLGCLDAR